MHIWKMFWHLSIANFDGAIFDHRCGFLRLRRCTRYHTNYHKRLICLCILFIITVYGAVYIAN